MLSNERALGLFTSTAAVNVSVVTVVAPTALVMRLRVPLPIEVRTNCTGNAAVASRLTTFVFSLRSSYVNGKSWPCVSPVKLFTELNVGVLNTGSNVTLTAMLLEKLLPS